MSPYNFKSHVSPHEVLQSVGLASKGLFKITQQSDCLIFLAWFLNTVHNYLKTGNNKDNNNTEEE